LEHADLDLDHVEPTGVFRGVMELEAAQDAASLGRGKGLVEGTGGMDRQVVLHDTDAGGLGIVDIDKFAHTVSVVHGGAPFGDLDSAPGPMRVEGDEEIDGAVAAVLVALALSRLGWDRLAHLADELDGGFVEAEQRSLGIRRFAVIYTYSHMFGRPRAETDMQRYFGVSPPSVHQMIVTLERNGLIRRQAGAPRSIEILVPPENLPILSWLGIKPAKSL
jgi:hypothetical protein